MTSKQFNGIEDNNFDYFVKVGINPETLKQMQDVQNKQNALNTEKQQNLEEITVSAIKPKQEEQRTLEQPEKTNYLMWVGIGVGVIAILSIGTYLLTRKN